MSKGFQLPVQTLKCLEVDFWDDVGIMSHVTYMEDV